MRTTILLFCIIFVILTVSITLLPAEKRFAFRDTLDFPKKSVWQVAFNVAHQHEWRSDITAARLIEREPRRVWSEQLKNGREIRLRDRHVTPMDSWQIESFDNPFFDSQWTGEFHSTPDGGTEIIFSEKFIARNIRGKVFLFLFIDPENLIRTYVNDLKKALRKK